MYIMPAIDLVDGKCVRLIQGQYHRRINYEDQPVRQAQSFIKQGARWLHIVDLDGAKIGKPINIKPISAIAALGGINIEVGGGIRIRSHINKLLEIGINRVIIGTKAVDDFDWFAKMSQAFPRKLALAIDARGSNVATHGWTRDRHNDLIEFATKASKLPIAAIIYTDITRDGMLSGPNLKRTKLLAQTLNIPVIASGGVKKTDDIRKLAKTNVDAVIIGRALYEKNVNLEDAISTAEEYTKIQNQQ